MVLGVLNGIEVLPPQHGLVVSGFGTHYVLEMYSSYLLHLFIVAHHIVGSCVYFLSRLTNHVVNNAGCSGNHVQVFFVPQPGRSMRYLTATEKHTKDALYCFSRGRLVLGEHFLLFTSQIRGRLHKYSEAWIDPICQIVEPV